MSSSDLYNRIVNDRGSFERMLTKLPGFEGYLDRKARRTADRMVRDYLADELTQRINRLAAIERRLLDQNGLAGMKRISSVKSHLQTYHDRIKTAAPGYSGFFEAVKVDSKELDLIYGFDELQMIYADKFAGALDALDKAVTDKSGVDEAVDSLDALIGEASDAFRKRDDILTGLGSN